MALEGADSLPWECEGHLQAGDQICLWALQPGLGLALQPGCRPPSWGPDAWEGAFLPIPMPPSRFAELEPDVLPHNGDVNPGPLPKSVSIQGTCE